MQNPGIYTLTGNSNILQAISAAGGISKYGSLREINLVRNNAIVETLDVYNLLIDGKYNIKKRLRSGDVIFVEARKNVVLLMVLYIDLHVMRFTINKIWEELLNMPMVLKELLI